MKNIFFIFSSPLAGYVTGAERTAALDESQRMYNDALQRKHDIGKGQSLVVMAFLYSTLNHDVVGRA